MTNKERLLAFVGFQPGTNVAEAALADNDLTPNDPYTKDNLSKVRLAAISVIEVLLSTPDTGNGVVGWTAKYDRDAILKRLAGLKEDAGLVTGSVIRAVCW